MNYILIATVAVCFCGVYIILFTYNITDLSMNYILMVTVVVCFCRIFILLFTLQYYRYRFRYRLYFDGDSFILFLLDIHTFTR